MTFLCVLAITALCWQVWEHATADSARQVDAMKSENARLTAAIGEIRQLTTQVDALLAGVRAEEQRRAAEGEKRRDEIQQAMRGDQCAGVVTPDDVDRLLQQHTTRATRGAGTGTAPGFTPESAGGATAPGAADVGRAGSLGGSVTGRGGNLQRGQGGNPANQRNGRK